MLTNVAKDANWQSKVAASNLSSANVVKGRGIAFGFYSNTMTCCVADITVTKSTGKIVANALHVAGDAGLIVYPAGSENNEEGAAMQGLSRALYEQVDFDKKGVTSLDWVSYPMIRFKDAPKIHIHGLTPHRRARPGRARARARPARASRRCRRCPRPSPTRSSTRPACGIREAPMTPSRVRGALKAAGK